MPGRAQRVLSGEASAADETLCAQVSLPLATGNTFQAKTTTAIFRLDAEQTAVADSGPAAHPATTTAVLKTTTAAGKMLGYTNSSTATVATKYDRQLFFNNAGNVVFGPNPPPASRPQSAP